MPASCVLFSSSVVNAVLVLILVSVLISTIYGSRVADRMRLASAVS